MPWTFNGRLHDKYILSDDRLLLAVDETLLISFRVDYVLDPEKSHDLDILFYNSAWNDNRESVLPSGGEYFFRWFGLTATAKPGWSPHHFSIESVLLRQKLALHIYGTAHEEGLI